VADGPDLRAAASHGAGPDARPRVAEQLGLIESLDPPLLPSSRPSAIYHSAPLPGAPPHASSPRPCTTSQTGGPGTGTAALGPDEHVASLLGPRCPGARAAAVGRRRAGAGTCGRTQPRPPRPARRLAAAASAAVPTGQGLGAGSRRPRPGGRRPTQLRLTARTAGWALAGGAHRRCRCSSPSPKRQRSAATTRSGSQPRSPPVRNARQPPGRQPRPRPAGTPKSTAPRPGPGP
jgi:hypothetical protein